MEAYRIGVDLGGTNIAAAIIDSQYRMIRKKSVKTNLPRSADAICADIAALCHTLCEEENLPFDKIASIGIGSPGVIQNGTVKLAANLSFYNEPIAETVSRLTGKPVSLKNDANAAALGEALVGSGVGYSSMVAVTLGTGVGGGIILNGKIVEGFNGAAGEIGHIILRPNGKPCACGNRGCFEAYCSATALIKNTKEAMANHPESLLHTLVNEENEVNGKTVFDAMRQGDKTAQEIVDDYITMLAVGISFLVQLLQPDVICIGGGVAAEGETLLAPLREKVSAQTLAGADGKRTAIVTATLGNDAGIIGAAL